MTKCEQILCAKKVWRNGRGRTAQSRKEAYLRELRRKNTDLPKGWNMWYVSNELGGGGFIYGTFRQAKLFAHQLRMWWNGTEAFVRDENTRIVVYETAKA